MSTTSIWRLIRKDLGIFAYKKKPPQILSQAITNKPLIRGRKIIQQLSKDSRHQVSEQMRNFHGPGTTTVKMTGF
ncbi:Hypothetical protein FKW44_020911 [Caligus rogercresseyi]|uniref:Uncharacterized protein n=1 Tax=Caligus rogercresseyi TaxID=217165 RepID=A0A7T8GQC8_CALRO|nr:Hypothetical protein FKW44_020911 [Caligus rogercresseyi]